MGRTHLAPEHLSTVFLGRTCECSNSDRPPAKRVLHLLRYWEVGRVTKPTRVYRASNLRRYAQAWFGQRMIPSRTLNRYLAPANAVKIWWNSLEVALTLSTEARVVRETYVIP